MSDCEHEWEDLDAIDWCQKCGAYRQCFPRDKHHEPVVPTDRAALLARIAELEGQAKGPGDWPLGHVWMTDPGVSRARYELRCRSVYGVDAMFYTNCPNRGAHNVRSLSHWAGGAVVAVDRQAAPEPISSSETNAKRLDGSD